MTVQTLPDSWRLFAEWLPNLAPGRWQDREVFERSNKRLNKVAPARPLRDGSGARSCGLRAALDLGPVAHETLAIQFL